MAGARIDFDTVRSIGLSLPEVEEGTIYRSPALKVRGKLMTCSREHRALFKTDTHRKRVRLDGSMYGDEQARERARSARRRSGLRRRKR